MTRLTPGDILKVGLWAFILVGMIIAWKWEGVGSLRIIGVTTVQFLMNPGLLSVWVMWIAPFTGILFAICWRETRNNLRVQSRAL